VQFEIDFPTIRKITAEELRQARKEIAERGSLAAYRSSLERHELRLAAAPDAATLACRSGCSWCCYFSVDVRAVEVLNILAFMEREFSSQERARIAEEIEFNKSALEKLSEIDRVRQNLKCPFLFSGRCSIYSVRPQTCRNYHATDSSGCKQSYEEPENLDIDPDFAPLTYQIGGAHVDAFSEAMSEAGYDVAAYELSTALSAAMSNLSEVKQRFEAKLKPFVALQGNEVPAEFMDDFAEDHGIG
jgi:Fe-S-cluster containining protein